MFVNRTMGVISHILGLESVDLKNLSSLYLATFTLRGAAFAAIAVMQKFILPRETFPDLQWLKGLLFTAYPLAEVGSVGYFGAMCDRWGRKRVLTLATFISAVAVFMFILPLNISETQESLTPQLISVAVFLSLFGIGAAAMVSSTLTMVSDHSHLKNRAQLMALFDIVTLGGLATGFGSGILALDFAKVSPYAILVAGGAGVLVSSALVIFFVRDTFFVRSEQARTWDLLRTVFSDKNIVRLLPVYIPVIALYGYIITFTEELLKTDEAAADPSKHLGPGLVIAVASLAIPLVTSMLLNSRLSDRIRKRRPFMAVGLVSFGVLAIIIASTAGRPIGELARYWPILAVASFGAGAFPPAALAYLGDVVKKSVSGTTFGIYSIIFGSGLIIGPILGGFFLTTFGDAAFAVLALSLIGVSGLGVFFLQESTRTVAALQKA